MRALLLSMLLIGGPVFAQIFDQAVSDALLATHITKNRFDNNLIHLGYDGPNGRVCGSATLAEINQWLVDREAGEPYSTYDLVMMAITDPRPVPSWQQEAWSTHCYGTQQDILALTEPACPFDPAVGGYDPACQFDPDGEWIFTFDANTGVFRASPMGSTLSIVRLQADCCDDQNLNASVVLNSPPWEHTFDVSGVVPAPTRDITMTYIVDYAGDVQRSGSITSTWIDPSEPPPPPPPTGSPLADAAAALQSDEVANFNMPGLNNNLVWDNASDFIHTWATKGYWNPVDQTIEFVGQGHSGDKRWIVYSEDAHEWTIAQNEGNLPAIGHAYEHFAINPATGERFISKYQSNRVHRYNGSGWPTLPGNTGPWYSQVNGIEYFPGADALVWLDWYADNIFWFKDGSWQTAGSFCPFCVDSSIQYSALVAVDGALLFGGKRKLWALLPNGSVQQLPNAPVTLGPTQDSNVMVADPTDQGAALLFGRNGGVWRFDGSWTQISSRSLLTNNAHFAVSLPEHGVVLIVNGTSAKLYRP